VITQTERLYHLLVISNSPFIQLNTCPKPTHLKNQWASFLFIGESIRLPSIKLLDSDGNIPSQPQLFTNALSEYFIGANPHWAVFFNTQPATFYLF